MSIYSNSPSQHSLIYFVEEYILDKTGKFLDLKVNASSFTDKEKSSYWK
jgi:hypothetical protein